MNEIEYIPIPVDGDILARLDDKIVLALDGEPLREGIVASLLNLDKLIAQHPEITVDQCIGLLKELKKRRDN